MRLVLDTNVILAGIVADGLCRGLIQQHTHPHSLFTSTALMRELDEKLKTKFAERLDDLPLILPYLKRMALVEPPPLPAPVCRDPDDDWVLATALAAKADAIVTGDNDLLVLKKFQGIRIVSPRQFMELLSP